MIRGQLAGGQRKELEKFRMHASAKDSEKALLVLMSSDGESVAQIVKNLRRNPHGFSVFGGIDEVVSRFRKLVWHCKNNRLASRIKFNLEAYADILQIF